MHGTLRWPVVVVAAICTDAGEAVANVRGIGDLPQFAVADAVDPGRNLLCNNLPDTSGEPRLERLLIKFAAGLARLQKGLQFRRARQAADMGRQDAVDAELHVARSLVAGTRSFHAPPNRARYGGVRIDGAALDRNTHPAI